MSDSVSTIDGTPKANAWKRRDRFGLIVVLIVACILAGAGLAVAWVYRPVGVTPSPTGSTGNKMSPVVSTATAYIVPQPEARITITESTGGKSSVKGSAEGASVNLSGEKVEGKDLTIAPTVLNLADIGGITGGAFTGSLSASAGGMFWIRMLGLAAFIGCGALAYLNFKRNPLDWNYWGSLALGSLTGLVVLVQPEMFYVGLAGVAVAALANFWPSITAGRVLESAKNYEDFIEANADVKRRWTDFRAGMTTTDKNTIDRIIKPSNV